MQLRFVENARGGQSPGEQRQPAVAAGQHAGDEFDESFPALIIELEHTIDGDSELIAALVRQSTARGIFIARACVGQHPERGSRAGGDGQLVRQP